MSVMEELPGWGTLGGRKHWLWNARLLILPTKWSMEHWEPNWVCSRCSSVKCCTSICAHSRLFLHLVGLQGSRLLSINTQRQTSFLCGELHRLPGARISTSQIQREKQSQLWLVAIRQRDCCPLAQEDNCLTFRFIINKPESGTDLKSGGGEVGMVLHPEFYTAIACVLRLRRGRNFNTFLCC